MSSSYQYQPLSSPRHTRLLVLQPHASHDAPLRCTLKEVSLDAAGKDRPKYDALSYVWGAKTGAISLLCDNETILITPNCELALRHIRHRRKQKVLWVDVVVIDQSNLEERAQQVPLMGEIYQSASEVIIWLGAGNVRTERAISQMRVRLYLLILRGLRGGYLHRPVTKTRAFELLGRASLEDVWILIDNEWTTRIWTIQELAVAAKPVIMYGRAKVSWRHFLEVLLSVWMPNFPNSLPAREVYERWLARALTGFIHGMDTAPFGPLSPRTKSSFLIHHVWMSQMSECSDPRDKIYGLYGLLSRRLDRLPAALYTATEDAVYEDFSRATVEHSGKFWLASTHYWKPPRALESPSWVWNNNWSDAEFADLIREEGFPTTVVSSTRESAVIVCTDGPTEPGILVLKGLPCTKIVAMAPTKRYSSQASSFASWLCFCWDRKLPATGGQGPTALDPFEALSAVLSGLFFYQSTDLKQLDDQFQNAVKLFRSIEATRLHVPGSSLFTEEYVSQYQSCEWSKNLVHYVKTRSNDLFATSNGHIGVSMGFVNSGDEIALLAGSDRPVILRQQGSAWRCIGSAYIPGFMKGEAWPDDITPDQMETFVLV